MQYTTILHQQAERREATKHNIMCKAIKSCANKDRTVRGINWKRSTLSLQSSVLNPTHRVPTSQRVAKTDKNHLKEEITPLIPTGIDEQYCQTMSNLGHAALLRRCELPL